MSAILSHFIGICQFIITSQQSFAFYSLLNVNLEQSQFLETKFIFEKYMHDKPLTLLFMMRNTIVTFGTLKSPVRS